MVATMVDRRQKLRWLKRPETIPQKTKFGPKNNSKPHIWSLSLNFKFFSRKSESQQKLSKKIIHFRIKFPSKNIRFTNHNSLNIIKSIFPQNTAKKLTNFTNFPANMFLADFRKSICIVPFVEDKELHSLRTWKANVCKCLYFSARKFLLPRGRKLLSGGWLNNFLKAACCLGLVKCFKMFHFN